MGAPDSFGRRAQTHLFVIEKQVREAALEFSFGVATFPPPGGN
jgi:hypothetical protein